MRQSLPVIRSLLSAGLFISLVSVSTHAADLSAEARDDFEQNVRPILAENCYGCHGPQKQEGSLRWDRKSAAFQGGLSGKVLEPGNPDASRMIRAIRRQGDLKMPPKKPLPADAVARLEKWVAMGAPWPDDPAAGAGLPPSPAERIDELRSTHWAFQPVGRPQPPEVKNTTWARNPIDRFVLAQLEAKKISPSPQADRRTLVRRVYIDLIGIYPTPQQTDAFVNDPAPDAYEKLVDALLASPLYGQRWARHWLDVARYADTKGYVFREDLRYPYAFAYRDYVIDAFNSDKPFDRFVIEQIAADRLQLPEGDPALAAMGFLTAGQRFLNRMPDIIDDRIDVVTRGFMGLTAACARCHDHKYDPIPTADYYSLYGVFDSSDEPDLHNMPVLKGAENPPGHADYLQELAKREKKVSEYEENLRGKIETELREHAADYLWAVTQADKKHGNGKQPQNRAKFVLRRRTIEHWSRLLTAAAPDHAVFGLFRRLWDLNRDTFEADAAALLADQAVREKSHPALLAALEAAKPKSMLEAAEIYGRTLSEAHKQPKPETDALRQALHAPDAPTTVTPDEARQLYGQIERDGVKNEQKILVALKAEHPGAPARAMVLVDRHKPREPRVFLRGDPARHGPAVVRRFFQVLEPAVGGREFPKDSSGRLELAQAIVHPDNPLTARVFVNRLWDWHIGRPLVHTTSDFGTRSDPPTHPQLLDHLARSFIEGGWSVKKLHRDIMLSATYRQTSDIRPEAAAVDPVNDLIWRMNRRRLEFEPTRDNLLAAAGRLDTASGGRSVDLETAPYTTRRTIYGKVDRYQMPGLLRSFDFADPEASSPGRPRTTVPQQALFLMNSGFALEQARHLIAREPVQKEMSTEGRTRALYRLLFVREPDATELALAADFIAAPKNATLLAAGPAWRYGYGELDETTHKLKAFHPLPHYADGSWQGSGDFPDKTYHYLRLTRDGGHVGHDQAHAAVRRWTAPADGIYGITGVLRHPAKEGDGVRGRVVAHRAGLIGDWSVHNGESPTLVDRVELKAGDTIDFVVDCRTGPGWDSFHWAPVVSLLTPIGLDPSLIPDKTWNASEDFNGPTGSSSAPSRWEQYAQALMLSNEFMFVD